MEEKKQRIALIALIAALVLILGGAGIAYRALTRNTENISRGTRAEQAGVSAEADTGLETITDETAEETGDAGSAGTEPERSSAAEISAAADPAPGFLVYDEAGEPVQLSDFLGRPVIINIWATWCPPCRGELPDYEEMYQLYGDEVEFLMIDMTDGIQETQELVRDYTEENSYTFPVYYDLDGSAARAYGIYAIPDTIAVDREGRLIDMQIGAIDRATLERFLTDLTR